METADPFGDCTNYDAVRQFMGGFHFIGYIERDRNSATVRALEISSRAETAIRFLKSEGAEVNKQMIIPQIVHHEAFLGVHGYTSLGNVNAYSMEYFDGIPLKTHIEKNGTPCAAESKAVFTKLLDAVSYLHRHRIAVNSIRPDNILIDAEFRVKFSNLDGAFFPSLAAGASFYYKDISALGEILDLLLFGSEGIAKYESSTEALVKADFLHQELACSLKYILSENPSPDIEVLYQINSLKAFRPLKKRPVAILDLLTVDQLVKYGLKADSIKKFVNDPSSKEHNMYHLCKGKVSRGTIAYTDQLKAQNDKSARSCIPYGSLRRREELVKRMHELMQFILESEMSFFGCFSCCSSGVKRLCIDLLMPIPLFNFLKTLNELRFSAYRRKNVFHIRNDELPVVMELIIHENGCIKKLLRPGNFGWLEFRKIHGKESNFIENAIVIVDQLRLLGQGE